METAPLRVLFLTPYFRPYLGGIERAIERLSFHLMQCRAVEAVAVLTTKYAFPRIPQPHWADRETTPERVHIFRLDGYPQRSLPVYSVPLVWFSPLQIRRYLEEFDPNVIHFVGDGWFWGHCWAWVWYRHRARFVFTPSFHPLPLRCQWLRPINAFLCYAVDRVVALTRLEEQQVRRAYWVRRAKLRVVGWGASPPAKPPLPSDQNMLTILCVGRLGEHKGQLWLLSVWLKARSMFHRATRLVLIGRDEGAQEAIQSMIRTVGLEQEVTLTGEVSDAQLAAWYRRSSLLVLFSRYEAFGLVFFEAMVCGVPVLTHEVGANRELLRRGASIVPRFDEPSAVEELVRLVNDDNYRMRLGREARDYALSGFTWSRVAEKYLRIYEASD